MKHLDERISELVDERLDYNERDQALAHLAVCAQCRNAVEYERTAKAALRSLPDVEPSQQLMASLFALAEPGGPMPPDRPSLARSAPVAGWRESSGSTRRRKGPRMGMTMRGSKLAAAGALSASGVVALLAAVGGPAQTAGKVAQVPDEAAAVVPSYDEFLIEHALTTGGLPFVEHASSLVSLPPAGDPAGEDGR